MSQDETLDLAIEAAKAALARATDADKPARAARAGLHEDPDAPWGSDKAVLAAIEAVWWICAGAVHRGAQSPGTRLSAFYSPKPESWSMTGSPLLGSHGQSTQKSATDATVF